MGRGKYVVVVPIAAAESIDAWARWNIDHARDMVTNAPGFLAGRAYRVRPDYASNHPEAAATRPPYDLISCYAVDERGIEWAEARRASRGGAPAGASRAYPTPLGPHRGNHFLLEALSEEFTKPGLDDGERTVRGEHVLLVMMDTGENTEAWTKWNIDHARDMVETTPGFVTARTYRVRPDYAGDHPEAAATRPPYDLVNYYELDSLDFVLNRRPVMGEGPAGGSRPFPAPLGPYLGDGYLLEGLCEEVTQGATE